MDDSANVKARRFIIEVSADTLLMPSDPIEAADELLDALGAASLPGWVFSVDGVDPVQSRDY